MEDSKKEDNPQPLVVDLENPKVEIRVSPPLTRFQQLQDLINERFYYTQPQQGPKLLRTKK